MGRDIYCFHLPTFYGIVVAVDRKEASAFLLAHGVLITPHLSNIHNLFGYLQHCTMLLAAVWLKEMMEYIAYGCLDVLDEYEEILQEDDIPVIELYDSSSDQECRRVQHLSTDAVSMRSVH